MPGGWSVSAVSARMTGRRRIERPRIWWRGRRAGGPVSQASVPVQAPRRAIRCFRSFKIDLHAWACSARNAVDAGGCNEAIRADADRVVLAS